MNSTDLELLSAYLDGMLTAEEISALEARLAEDTALRRELESLRATVALLGDLPELRAPRDLRLTRAMVQPYAQRRPPIALFSALSAAAAFILIAVGVIGLTSSQLPAPDSAQVAFAATETPAFTATITADATLATESDPAVESLSLEIAAGNDATDAISSSQRAAETSQALPMAAVATDASMVMQAPADMNDQIPELTAGAPPAPELQIMQAFGGAAADSADTQGSAALNYAAEAEVAVPASAPSGQESGMAAGSIAAMPVPQGTMPPPTASPMATQPPPTRALTATVTASATHTSTPTDTATNTLTPSATPTSEPTAEPPVMREETTAEAPAETVFVILIMAGVLLLAATVVVSVLRRTR